MQLGRQECSQEKKKITIPKVVHPSISSTVGKKRMQLEKEECSGMEENAVIMEELASSKYSIPAQWDTSSRTEVAKEAT